MADSQGTLPGFPSPHLRHFPERISAVRVVVLEASGNCEVCACRMISSSVVFKTRRLVYEGEAAGGRDPRAAENAAVLFVWVPLHLGPPGPGAEVERGRWNGRGCLRCFVSPAVGGGCGG